MLYNKGSWKTIISSSDDLQIPKGFGGYKVESPVFIETDKNNVLLPVSIGKTDYFTTTSGTTVQSYFVPYAIYLYNGNNLITIDKDELKIVSSASAPARVRPMPVMNGAITTLSLFGDAKFFRYNLANPKVEPLPELRTEGTEKFLLSSIIATYDENRVIATTTRTVESKRNKEILTAGFFELTRAIQ